MREAARQFTSRANGSGDPDGDPPAAKHSGLRQFSSQFSFLARAHVEEDRFLQVVVELR